ncbi:MAG TPA: ATP-binding protein [Candidatus Dormibacteraeota bacterium]|nr:ATP-binding protein [Candidatus Dormibacteraeota bacterium]
MTWERRDDQFEALLERAPVMALLLDGDRRVIAANAAARAFFRFAREQLPLGLLDATREGRLLEALRDGTPSGELRLTHRQRTVQMEVAPRPPGTLVFLTDVTELRRLETVRQEFVANLSHELRTPLTSLRLAVESLLADPPPAARERFAARALLETDYLAGIVANLRELAHIEAGRTALTLSRFGVRDLVEEAASRLRLGRPLELSIPDGLHVTADRMKLAQVLDNLLDNAARFSPPGSPVVVAAALDDGEFRLTVRDHGPGISPEHWPRVFERFYKVDPARSRPRRTDGQGPQGARATTGSGLGLAITKHLVLAQGGRVWTEAARDRGQIFGLAIPMPINNAVTHT